MLEAAPLLEQVAHLDDSTEIGIPQREDALMLIVQQGEGARGFPNYSKGWTLGDIRRWIDDYASANGHDHLECHS